MMSEVKMAIGRKINFKKRKQRKIKMLFCPGCSRDTEHEFSYETSTKEAYMCKEPRCGIIVEYTVR